MNKYAYMAGMLDGEGYIGVTKIKSRYKGGYGYQYKTRVVIANCNLVLLEKIQEMFGGYIAKKPHKNKKWTQGYNLQIGYIQTWLPKVIPYMIGKKRKAIFIMEASKLLSERSKKTNQAGNLHAQRLDEIMQLLKKKEWEV